MLGIQTSSSIELKNNILALASLGKVFGLPTILTTSTASGPNGQFMSEIKDMFPDEEVLDRTFVNAWDDENFVEKIKETGRKKLIMCGITTDVCLLFPALSAVQEGYDVYAVTDCSGCFNKQAETSCILRMTQAGVKMTSWGSVASELLNDWSLPVGTELGKTLAEHLTALGYVANNMQGAHEELA